MPAGDNTPVHRLPVESWLVRLRRMVVKNLQLEVLQVQEVLQVLDVLQFAEMLRMLQMDACCLDKKPDQVLRSECQEKHCDS